MKQLRVIKTIQTAITNARRTSLPEYVYQTSRLAKYGRPDNNAIFFCVNSDPVPEGWLNEIDGDIAFLVCAYREANCMEVPEMEFMMDDNYARLIKILKFSVHNFARCTTIAHLFDAHYTNMLHMRSSNCPEFCNAVVELFADGKNPKRQTIHSLRGLKFTYDVVESLEPGSFLLWFFDRHNVDDQWRGGVLTRPQLSTEATMELIKTTYPNIYNVLVTSYYNVTLRHVSRIADRGVAYFTWLIGSVGSLRPALETIENYSPRSIQAWVGGCPALVKMVGEFLYFDTLDPKGWLDGVYTEELRLRSSVGREAWLTPEHCYSNGKAVLEDFAHMTPSTINTYLAHSRKEEWFETTDRFRTYCVAMSQGTIYTTNLLEMYTDIQSCIRSNVYLEQVGLLLMATWENQILLGAIKDKLHVSIDQFYSIPHGGGTIEHTLARMGYTANTSTGKKDVNGYTPAELTELNVKRRRALNRREIFQKFSHVGEICVGLNEILEFSNKREQHTEFEAAYKVAYAGQLGHRIPENLTFPSPYEEYANSSYDAIAEVYEIRNTIASMLDALGQNDRKNMLLYIEQVFGLLEANMLVDWDAVKTLYGIE